ncbi:MAG: hypothetical protein PHY08_09320, partial [Candidatus Cloacimonetes bacterium]|nr:hypothetical protein [Candidatus Cloacimonadota bacterium]
GLILLILHHFTSIIVSIWIDIPLLAIVTFTSGFSCFLVFIQKDEEYFKAKTEPYFRNLFLAGLLIITIGSLKFDFIEKSQILNSIVSFIISIQFYLVLATVGFGFITFYFNRERIEAEADLEKEQEEKAEKKREEEFDKKFSYLTRFDLNYAISDNWNKRDYGALAFRGLIAPFVWIVRLPYSFVRWMYREGWFYSGGLIAIILILTIIQLSIIGNYYFWTDEVFSFNAGKMILEKGEPLYDSGLYYGRAPIYHTLMAYSMSLFGVDEFGSRVINVFFNALSAVAIYFVIRKKSKIFALIGSALFLTSNLMIVMTIETRFYTMLSFLYLISAMSFYNAFLNNEKLVNKVIIKNHILDFNFKWLIVFLLFFYLAYDTHNFFFLLIFGILLYTIYQLIFQKPNIKHILLIISTTMLIFIGAYYITGSFNLKYSYFEAGTLDWAINNPINPSYYTDILKENINIYEFVVVLSIISVLSIKNSLNNYLLLIIAASLFFISYQKTLQERYIFFLIPIIFLFIVINLEKVYNLVHNKNISKIWILLIFSLFLFDHSLSYYNEITDTSFQNESCLTTYKKLQFYEAMDYIDKNKEGHLLVADWHAAHTLKMYNYDVNYILISEKKIQLLENGIEINGTVHDEYFNVPFLIQESEEYETVLNKKAIFILRDEYKLPIKINLTKVQSFKKPVIYIN